MNKKITFSLIIIITLITTAFFIQQNKIQYETNISPKYDNKEEILDIKEDSNKNYLTKKANELINEDLLNEKINSVNTSKEFMRKKEEEKQKEKDKIAYYESLPTSYSVDINNQIPFEESLFKDEKIKMVGSPTDKEIVQKFVFEFPMSQKELYELLNITVINKEQNNFTIDLPYQNRQGEIETLKIKDCEHRKSLTTGNFQIETIYCNNREFKIHNGEDLISLTLTKFPTTIYKLTENQLFMYNHLNENLEYERDPNGWGMGGNDHE